MRSLKNFIMDEFEFLDEIMNKAKHYDRQKIVGLVEEVDLITFILHSFKIGSKTIKLGRGGNWQTSMNHSGEARLKLFERLLKARVTYEFVSDEPINGTKEMLFHLESVTVNLFERSAPEGFKQAIVDWKKNDIRII